MVVGFLFDDTGDNVLLIRKNRPDWMAGRLNGIGGKVESGESPESAMYREFWEETGVTIAWPGWTGYAVLRTDHDTEVRFYAHRSTDHMAAATAMTDEALVRRNVGTLRVGDCLPNLAYLVHMGWYAHTYQALAVDIREGVKW